MTLKIRYFAWVREQTGRAEEDLVVPEGVATGCDLMAWLRTRGPEFEAAFERPEIVRAAIDQVHVKPDALIDAGVNAVGCRTRFRSAISP